MSQHPVDRIVSVLHEVYPIPPVSSYEQIVIGYEDVNIRVKCAEAEFVLKLFLNGRTPEQCELYTQSVVEAIGAGVRHPRLIQPIDHRSNSRFLGRVQEKTGDIACLMMEWIPLPTLFEDSRPLSVREIESLASQIQLIQGLTCRGVDRYDNWALQNLAQELLYCETSTLPGYAAIQSVSLRLREVPSTHESFVHGDLVPTNIIRDGSSVHVLDFGRGSRRPRLHEIAVVIAQTLTDPLGKPDLRAITAFVGKLKQLNCVAPQELVDLPTLVSAVYATYLVAAAISTVADVDDSEHKYWATRSREGLLWAESRSGREFLRSFGMENGDG